MQDIPSTLLYFYHYVTAFCYYYYINFTEIDASEMISDSKPELFSFGRCFPFKSFCL